MYILVNGVNIHYQVLGEGNPLIILNPNSISTGIMKKIAKKLSCDFKVYLFDRRGCGKSQKNCELTYDASSKDVYEFIIKLNLKNVYVLGLSGGGSVALNLAIKYPECVEKLVLLSAVARFSSVRYSKFVTFLFDHKLYSKNVEKFLKMNNSSKDVNKEELLNITADTLVVNGGIKDIVPKEEAKFIHENIAKSSLLILEKEGHGTYINKEYFQSKVKEFLKR